MPDPTCRGMLIVFEGLDKAGKSSQVQYLSQTLSSRGQRVKVLRFPNRSSPIGQQIDAYLRGATSTEDHVIHLLFSANRWEAAKAIEDHVAAGTTVIIDRYYYSGIVYSAAKRNPSLSLEWARKCDEGLPRPDICIFLSISIEEAAKRGGFGEEKYEKREMQQQVRELFEDLMKGPDGTDFRTVDGGRTFDEVGSDVVRVAEQTMDTVQTEMRPLRKVIQWT